VDRNASTPKPAEVEALLDVFYSDFFDTWSDPAFPGSPLREGKPCAGMLGRNGFVPDVRERNHGANPSAHAAVGALLYQPG
jgi:hypothetical protein